MRIVFMGTPEFARPSLQVLLDHHYDVTAVVTPPDKPQGRGKQIASCPVKEFALSRSLRVLQPADLSDPDFVSTLAALRPDVLVVVAFRILPKVVYSIPPKGAFNLHASLLPKYRGAAPIQWAIIKGETETGVTTFLLQDKVDTGSILLQARVKIGPHETAGELHDRLSEVGAEIVLQTVRLIELGKAQPRKQDDSQATPAPKIFRENCTIPWEKPANQIHNFVRGLSPVPCAWTRHGENILKIYKTSTAPPRETVAGKVVEAEKNSLIVSTGDGCISILEIQQEGKKRLAVGEFLKGYRLTPGDSFH